jgi:hypothetical protein
MNDHSTCQPPQHGGCQHGEPDCPMQACTCGQPHYFTAMLDAGIWEDDLGKHIRFAVTEHGVAIQIDLLHPGEDDTAVERQVETLLGLMTGLPELVGEVMDRTMGVDE